MVPYYRVLQVWLRGDRPAGEGWAFDPVRKRWYRVFRRDIEQRSIAEAIAHVHNEAIRSVTSAPMMFEVVEEERGK